MNRSKQVGLKRSLGVIMLTFYGLGTIVGAGIYVLIGEVAAVADNLFPYAFLLAGFIASFTALSYAELGSRYPFCAGEAVYVEAAWHKRSLSSLIGWLIVITGIVSAATIVNGFVGYLSVFMSVNAILAMICLALILWLIAVWGIDLSAKTIFIITVIELLGLLYVIVLGFQVDAIEVQNVTSQTKGVGGVNGLILGTFLAFYAFIGFEDMVNIIEEVKDPQRTFPIAIIVAMILSVLIYGAVALVALRVMTPEQLGLSEAPLADLVTMAGGNPLLISLISLLAVINGALVQILMGSRVLYGMGNKNMAPKWLGSVHHFTRTPVLSTTLVCALVIAFAITLPLVQLAQLTSLIMLTVFVIINIALISIKSTALQKYKGLTLPVWVPLCGAVGAFSLLAWQIYLFM